MYAETTPSTRSNSLLLAGFGILAVVVIGLGAYAYHLSGKIPCADWDASKVENRSSLIHRMMLPRPETPSLTSPADISLEDQGGRTDPRGKPRRSFFLRGPVAPYLIKGQVPMLRGAAEGELRICPPAEPIDLGAGASLRLQDIVGMGFKGNSYSPIPLWAVNAEGVALDVEKLGFFGGGDCIGSHNHAKVWLDFRFQVKGDVSCVNLGILDTKSGRVSRDHVTAYQRGHIMHVTVYDDAYDNPKDRSLVLIASRDGFSELELPREPGQFTGSGDFVVKHLGTLPVKIDPVSGGSSHRQDGLLLDHDCAPGGATSLYAFSHPRAMVLSKIPPSLRWISGDIPCQLQPHPSGPSPAVKIRTPNKLIRLAISLPPLPGNSVNDGVSDPLDWKVQHLTESDVYLLGKNLARITGLQIPEAQVVGWNDLNVTLPTENLPADPTLRQVLAVYLKPAYDAGMSVIFDEKAGIIEIREPWTKRFSAWVKKHLAGIDIRF